MRERTPGQKYKSFICIYRVRVRASASVPAASSRTASPRVSRPFTSALACGSIFHDTSTHPQHHHIRSSLLRHHQVGRLTQLFIPAEIWRTDRYRVATTSSESRERLQRRASAPTTCLRGSDRFSTVKLLALENLTSSSGLCRRRQQ